MAACAAAALARIAIGCALVFAVIPAAHGEWVALGKARGAPDVAYDSARVRYEPPYVTTWTRIVLPSTATLANGVRYRSAQQKVAIDCEARTWGIVYSEFYDNRDASGVPAFTDNPPRDEWELRPAQAGSNGERLVRALCATPRPW